MKDFKKNQKGDIIRVELKEYKGSQYLHIRNFYPGKNGEMIPTTKGVALPISIAQDIITAAQKELA